MKKIFIFFYIVVLSLAMFTVCTASEQGVDIKKETAADKVTVGEGLFKRYCAMCHPNGGNIINHQKTLHKDVRESFGIKTADDIIKLMRNPGPGMRTFNETDIPDKDAKEIAEYILKTF